MRRIALLIAFLVPLAAAANPALRREVEAADAKLAAGNATEALAAYGAAEKSAREVTMRAEIIARRGQALEKLGHDPEAIAEYRRAIAIAPKGFYLQVELLARIVDLHRRAQTLPVLLAELDKAWPVAARGHLEWSVLGKLREETGAQGEAIKAFQAATAAAPYELDTQRRLIMLLENSGRDAEALAQLKILVGVAPGEARFGLDYAERLFRAKEPGKAIEHALRLEARFPRDPGVLSALMDLHLRWGRDKHADALKARIAKLPP